MITSASLVELRKPKPASSYIKSTGKLTSASKPVPLTGRSGPSPGTTAGFSPASCRTTEGLIVPNDGWRPESKGYQNADFVHFIDSKYKMTPDAISSDSVQAFSAGQVLTQAVTQAQSLDNVKIMTILRQG